MDQIGKNKAELLEMIEQIAHKPITMENIRSLSTLRNAYKALCLISKEEDKENSEPVKMRPKVAQTV